MTFLPALEFVFTHSAALQSALSSPTSYSGLIATSPRGCLAASLAFSALSSSLPPTTFSSLISRWSALPCYTVGEASASLLTSTFPLTVTPVGGNAAALAQHIVALRSSGDSGDSQPLPLLVLSGQLRREELFDGLKGGGVAYEELQVYETQRREGVVGDVARLLEEAEGERDEVEKRWSWMVFFSPSGVEAVHHAVAVKGGGDKGLSGWRMAALGNTSATAIRQVLTLLPHPPLPPSLLSTPPPITCEAALTSTAVSVGMCVWCVVLCRGRCVSMCAGAGGLGVQRSGASALAFSAICSDG